VNDFFVFLIFPMIFCFLLGLYFKTEEEKKKLKKELNLTRGSLKELCEICMEHDIVQGKITYEAYFKEPIDHSGDGCD